MASSAHAVIDAIHRTQVRLLADDGTPMTGEATITFRVINAESGTELWKETQTVPLTNRTGRPLGADEADNPLDTDVLQRERLEGVVHGILLVKLRQCHETPFMPCPTPPFRRWVHSPGGSENATRLPWMAFIG